MMFVLVILAIIASTIIILWHMSEKAHARSQTAAMRQLAAAIKYLKKRNNG